MFLPNGGITQNWASVQGVLFLEVALTESWVICEYIIALLCSSMHDDMEMKR